MKVGVHLQRECWMGMLLSNLPQMCGVGGRGSGEGLLQRTGCQGKGVGVVYSVHSH